MFPPYTQQGGITGKPQTNKIADEQNNLHSEQTEPEELVSNPVSNIVTAVWKNLWLGWLVVALILFIRKITVYQDFVKYIRAGCVEVADIDLLEQFGKLIERNKVKTTVELYTNNLISSPLLIGFFRPSIVLPSADLSPVDFEYTILHELMHYKRRDMFYKWLVQFSVCVHWFNPLVYLMSREVGRACELSCDEAVIKALDLQGQRAYGDTLLNAMGAGGNYKDSLASVTLNEGKELLKERLDAIMKFKSKSKLLRAIALTITLLIVTGAVVLGAYAAQPIQFEKEKNIDSTSATSNIEANTQKSTGILPDTAEELNISLDIDNGGVKIIPTSSNQIIANYDNRYYDVQMEQQGDLWIVSISGKVTKMGETDDVQLQVPNIKSNMNADVFDGDFIYSLPEKCENEINVIAANSGVQFMSTNNYDNCNISLVAQNKDFIIYEPPVYPNYFTKTANGVEYKNGTEINKISISLSGYTSVEFKD